MEMLRHKETLDQEARQKAAEMHARIQMQKIEMQQQLEAKERIQQEAYSQYLRERAQVDGLVNQMI